MKFYHLIVIVLFLSSCSDSSKQDENLPPTASFSVAPGTGDTTVVFLFDASLSSDTQDPKSLLTFKWDFEGNRNWTEAVSDPEINHRYSKPGTYEVGLKVIDTEGWSGETSKTVIVSDSL